MPPCGMATGRLTGRLQASLYLAAGALLVVEGAGAG